MSKRWRTAGRGPSLSLSLDEVSLSLDEGLLSWQDVLEDGNVFWEIAYTDTPDWPEPERWYQTVCNFFQLLAWERLMLNPARLYPTARLQIVRDLFFREWQSRSRRLSRELYPLYFPDEPEEARAAMAVRAKTLSDYEEERNRQARVSITVPTHSPTRGKPRRPPEHSAPRSFALTIRKHTSHRRHHPCRPSHHPRVRLHRPRALPRCRHGHIPHRPLSAAASRSP